MNAIRKEVGRNAEPEPVIAASKAPRPSAGGVDDEMVHLLSAEQLATALAGKLEWMIGRGLCTDELRMAAGCASDALSDIRGAIKARTPHAGPMPDPGRVVLGKNQVV